MTQEEFIAKIPLAKKAEIIAVHESGLIAINKGAGLAAHPNPVKRSKTQSSDKAPSSSKPQPPCAIRAPYNFDREYFSWTDENGTKLRLHLVNRLDSPTSGVMILSTNKETADAARLAFKGKSVKKTYYAICIGKPHIAKGVWNDLIKKDTLENYVRASAANSGDLATTEYLVEKSDANSVGFYLLKLEPITGKTHQLRIQCAQRKFPILGDATYGDFRMNKRVKELAEVIRLFLHCAYTKLEFELNGKKMSFEANAPMPNSFSTIMDYNAKLYSVSRGFAK